MVLTSNVKRKQQLLVEVNFFYYFSQPLELHIKLLFKIKAICVWSGHHYSGLQRCYLF